MAEAVVLSAVIKIGVALGNEAIMQASMQFPKLITQLTVLQGSMGRIGRELRLMHAFLCRVDVRNRKNQTYEIWVQQLRILAHGIEDIVDEYVYLVGHKHDTGWVTYLKKSKGANVLLSFKRIVSLVKEAEINLVHLFKAKDRWVSMVDGGNSSGSSYIVEMSQHLASISRSLGEEDLVGVNKNRATLEQLLAGDDLECSVIALHGMGGLGKTTLAANVYKKEREKFECHAWVSISQTYSIKEVLECLLTELYKGRNSTPGNMEHMETKDLQDKLKTFLEDKKYLIVLDDVWAPEAVNELFGALVQNMKRSRVLVTTRIDAVANHALQDRRIALEALSKDDSWELFCKMGFSGDTNYKCPTELAKLARGIVSKCKGIPLAIVAVGRLLFVRDKTREEFKRIRNQLDYWELANHPSMEHVRNILYLSFIYLPTSLKSCFLHCSLFTEDYIFHRKKLARLWIAEGFIEERPASTLEEVAEGYMEELVHRNMIQLVERNSFGRIKKIKMHDILRELAVHLCQSNCFGVTYEENKYGMSLKNDGRRLVVHKLKKEIEQSISSIHHLRSFIALDNSMPSVSILPLLSEKSRFMTVLELSGLPISKIPYAIGDLFNLRYLGLRNSKVKMLPGSIDKLSNLLILDLHNSDMQKLPRGIVNLKKLRHLFAQKFHDPSGRVFHWSSGVSIGKGLGKLTNMQTLQALVVEDESVRQLGELKQLKSLRLLNVKRIYCGQLCKSLVQLKFLSTLHVNASDENELLQLNALPPNLRKLGLRGLLDVETLSESYLFQAGGPNLYSVGLYWSGLKEDPLPFFSQLTNLTELNFTAAYNGEQLVFRKEWFPNLKALKLRDLPLLKRIEIEEGAMVTLETLLVIKLNSLIEVPPGIKFLMNLQYVGFHEITSEFSVLLRDCPRIGGMSRLEYSLET